VSFDRDFTKEELDFLSEIHVAAEKTTCCYNCGCDCNRRFNTLCHKRCSILRCFTFCCDCYQWDALTAIIEKFTAQGMAINRIGIGYHTSNIEFDLKSDSPPKLLQKLLQKW